MDRPLRIYLGSAVFSAALIALGIATRGEAIPAQPKFQPAPAMIQEIPALIEDLVQPNTERNIHGSFHAVRRETEEKLWRIVRNLPVAPGGDAHLIRALDDVYTKYHEVYYVGWDFHYPYLDSAKAVELAEKLEKEYPSSPKLPRALLLRAFAYRVLPPRDDQGAEVCPEAQLRWKADPHKARTILQDLIARFPDSEEAGIARRALERAEEDGLEISLPIDYAEDPRLR